MKQRREFCANCGGSGMVTCWVTDEPMSPTDYRTAHAVKQKCIQCSGNGYIEYAMFTLEEANSILKHCGLSAES